MSLRVRGGEDTGSIGGTDPIGDAFYPLYDRLFSEDSQFVGDLEGKLAQSRMPDPVEMYLSRALGIGVLSGLLLWLLGLLLGWLLFATGIIQVNVLLGIPIQNETLLAVIDALRIPTLVIVTGVVFGAIGFGLGFGSLVAVPYSRASAREREINMLLTDAVSFMYALSVGGLDQLEILEAIAEADDTYGEVSKEFQSIVQETTYFDVDYKTAIRNQAIETPSDELAQFLTDMLSIVNSGGDMRGFLEDKKDKHMRTAKQQQELILETLELFGEMYMTLSLFPLLLIIIMVIMQMMPDADVSNLMLYSVVYGLIPLTGVGFVVMVATVKRDEVGSGYLTDADDVMVYGPDSGGFLNLTLVEQFTGDKGVFDRIKNREGTHQAIDVIKRPHVFFRDNPLYTLILTVPIALLIVVTAVAIGSAPLSWSELEQFPIWGTFIYLYAPLYITLIPLAIFREWNVRHRMAVTSKLSEDLRKLSSANDTGLTLLESMKAVADTTTGRLPGEFDVMHTKVHYGTGLNKALHEFNNKYHIPRLARTVKLITKAQEASNQISSVLRTAAQASENHDEIERDRKSRTRMQVVIIIMTFLTMLAVIAILQVQFIDTMAGLADTGEGGVGGDVGGSGVGGGQDFADINTDMISLLFFHAIVLQGIMSGFISGYMRSANLMSGLKYVIVLSTIALVAWMAVT